MPDALPVRDNLGSHMSIAGGLDEALRRGRAAGCGTVQLFTGSARSLAARGKEIGDDDVRRFEAARIETGIERVVVHAGYLINLATPGRRLWELSVDALVGELRRAGRIRAADLVLHPGAHVGAGEDAGLRRIVEGIQEALDRSGRSSCRIAIEMTAGQGTSLGHRFEHIRAILDGVRAPGRLSVCFDTCHAFAAGYDLRTPRAVAGTLAEFDRVVGLERLTVFHLNDSVKELGSRVDRHTHIGKGEIGREGFRALVRDRRFRDVPMILETPKEDKEGSKEKEGTLDRMNLSVLRTLRDGRGRM